jgi:hypothetical protein
MAELRVKSTGTIKLFENDNTSNVTIASPASLGADRTVTLPDGDVTLSTGTMSVLTGSTNNQVTTVTGANAIQGETNLIYNGTILGAGADGANADLGTGLHVKEADSGGSVNSTYASLVVEGSGSCGMQFLGGTTGNQEIRFGDSGSNSIGWIKYDNNDNSMNFRVNEATTMHIDSAGAVTKELQPAFWVSNSTVQSAFSTGVSHTIEFDTERFDQNADFNTTTYTFTAPVTGRYLFSEKIQLKNLDQSARYYEMQLVTSNKTYYTMIFDTGAFSTDPEYLSFTGTNLVDMDASDTCLCKIYQDDGAAQADVQANSSAFSGYLAC